MSLYAVKNDEGKYWYEVYETWTTTPCDCWQSKESADDAASEHHSRVVELVEKPAPEVVSEEEAKMLERVKSRKEYPAKSIHRYVYDSHNFSEWDYDRENRLIRAYVIGWTVEKPKRWNVKVPHTKGVWYYKASSAELLTICPANKELRGKFTAAEIDQYGLQDCEKEEVTENEVS